MQNQDPNLKWCANPNCSLYKQIVDSKYRYCDGVQLRGPHRDDQCKSKLREFDPNRDGNVGDADTPVLFIDSTPPSQRLLTEGRAKGDEPLGTVHVNCDLKGCPIAPKAEVYLPYSLMFSWFYLARVVEVEWIAYLKGKLENGIYIFDPEGMYFPMQQANGVHVEAESGSANHPDTIGAVHSHVGMKTEWSSEDEHHFSNPVEFVVNKLGSINAVMRIKLDCGRYSRVKPEITLVGTKDDVGLAHQLREKLIIIPDPRSSKNVTVTKGQYGVNTYTGANGKGFEVYDRRHSAITEERSTANMTKIITKTIGPRLQSESTEADAKLDQHLIDLRADLDKQQDRDPNTTD